MNAIWLKRATSAILLGIAIVGITWFAWPQPIPVDLETAKIGAMEVTVDEEARTRVRHIYTISAPVAGKLLRISHPDRNQTSRHVGDQVTANESVVAVMQPMAPSFLDIRSREELQAAVTAPE